MLTEIKLTNFKCFKEETAIPLSQFNLFTGVNGAGKSTALQALLLMRQSIEHDPYTTELLLNGSCVNLGVFNDLRNRNISAIEPVVVEFCFQKDNAIHKGNITYMIIDNENYINHISEISVKLSFFQNIKNTPEILQRFINSKDNLYESNNDKSKSIFYRLIKLVPHYFGIVGDLSTYFESPEEYSGLYNTRFDFDGGLDLENIHFISADRIGPQEFYQKSMLPQFCHVGTKGEFAINLLDKLAQELVDESLCLGDDARTLITQTQAWLGKILNPVTIKINPLRVNILELLIDGFKPSNVGFGYSSILPIIVTGLIAKPNEKIIIENPEIHLHPKAQSALIEFLVKVANTGVQIFIESHSDHVLNALRIATKNKLLKPDDVNILFFAQENGNSKIIKPTIDENGRISEWPDSFFDETAKSLASLAAGQRPRFKAPEA